MNSAMGDSNDTYWRRKLSAYLHDSPDKVLDILDHEQRARRVAGSIPGEEQSRRDSDWEASAADRLPFPPSAATRTALSRFRHPMGGSEISLNEGDLPVGVAEETSQVTRPRLDSSGTDPRAEFIATWRLWRNWAASRHPDFALYPAETRLPDHTIWNHLAMTSAMQGCLGGEPWQPGAVSSVADSPAFLLVTLGPVQEFIAAARSTRDLWSGSYLISYLMGHALRRIALDFGPDHVVFPNLCDQPILDLLLKDEVWSKASVGAGRPLSETLACPQDPEFRERVLTPSLPNRFLAVLPSEMAEHRHRGPQFGSVEAYAAHLVEDLRRAFRETIAGRVSKAAREAFGDRFKASRFDLQVDRILEVHWQIHRWPETFEEAVRQADLLPAEGDGYAPREGLAVLRDLCAHGADPRYLEGTQPKRVAAAWSALYAVTEWLLDGTKSNRGFRAAAGGHLHPTQDNTKDSLNGREEAVLRVGDAADAAALSSRLAERLRKNHLLKEGENLGAGTLIKRLWPFAVLPELHGFDPGDLSMPNTRGVAAGRPWGDDDEEEAEGGSYFAVLALDGDSMGKWISGSMTPELGELLSEPCLQAYRNKGARLGRRPLSPSWHLQFSEALGNFSQHAARRIVEAFNGRLIYAGGDDVLAMLPAESALDCAQALRMAFQGDPAINAVALGVPVGQGRGRRSDRQTPLFQIQTQTPGFLRLAPGATRRHGESATVLDDPVQFPVLVPGPKTDCSVGIAIAHFKSPLQDVVREAQRAEKRAKRSPAQGGLGRGAVAVTLLKRSGEITEWGCRWSEGGIEAFKAILEALATGTLGGRFPHRLVELVERYQTDRDGQFGGMKPAPGFDAVVEEVLRRELATVLQRQVGRDATPEAIDTIRSRILAYLGAGSHRTADDRVRALIGLCQTVAFIERNLTQPE